MSVVVNLAAERACPLIDSLLDQIEGIRRELDLAPLAEPAEDLRELANRLTMLATTVVMHQDLDRRFRRLQR